MSEPVLGYPTGADVSNALVDEIFALGEEDPAPAEEPGRTPADLSDDPGDLDGPLNPG